jgi:hypothetical protein
MNKFKNSTGIIFFFILLLTSCTSLSENIQKLFEKKDELNNTNNQIKVQNYCKQKFQGQLFLEDPQIYLNPIIKNSSITFTEKAIAISLIEMERRPDAISPYSRLQVLTNINGELRYYDFRPKKLEDDNKISYLYGLSFILNENKTPHNLLTLANIIDKSFPSQFQVSQEFETFLTKNKTDIQKNSELAKLYLKGSEILTRFETFPRINLQKSISNFMVNKLFDNSSYEHSKNDLITIPADDKKNIVKCNFDIHQDNYSPNELFFDNEYSSNAFAFTEKNNFFIAIASSSLGKPLKLKDEYFIKSRPAISPLPICFLSNPLLNHQLIIASSKGRSPSQHIKHLIDYDLINSPTIDYLGHTINFARHLFLTNPDRILYESKKGRKEQLDFFLQMNFPIYHVDSLGEVMALASFSNKNEPYIVKDERSNKQLECIP